tara:strand:+ start:1820 stop:2047 length:228 start_codon:yes stop_codon:yes gene_type:complete
MKLVWENERATVQAPKALRSAWPNSPNNDRDSFVSMYPIARLGAMEMQRLAQKSEQEKAQKKRDNVMAWLDGLGV